MPPTPFEIRAAEIAECGSGSPMTPDEREGWRGFPAVDQERATMTRRPVDADDTGADGTACLSRKVLT